MQHGSNIEDYLDTKFTRQVHQQMLISTVISNDPDFAMPDDHPEMRQTIFADGKEEEQSGDTDSMANVTVTSGATGRTVRSTYGPLTHCEKHKVSLQQLCPAQGHTIRCLLELTNWIECYSISCVVQSRVLNCQ